MWFQHNVSQCIKNSKNLLMLQILIKEMWQLLLTSMLSNSVAIFVSSLRVVFCCCIHRWWPAQICNPRDVPTNIQNMRHQPGEFPVQFLGSHDYYWIHRGRVFSYQEGDKGSTDSGTNKNLAKIFKRGECTSEKIFLLLYNCTRLENHTAPYPRHIILVYWSQAFEIDNHKSG